MGCHSMLTEEKQTSTVHFDTLIHAGNEYDYGIHGKYYPIVEATASENDAKNSTENFEAVFNVTQYMGDDEIAFQTEPIQKEFFADELSDELLKHGFLTQPRIVEIDKSHDKILFETSVKIPGNSVEKKLLFYVMISGDLRHYSQ